MAADEDKSNDFYAVLGLNKECTTEELRNEYKKLAMKWHPDRCSASGNPKSLEESKKKFQAIQQAYSVLSDANKRFLYDVGVYDCNDDDDENGMGDFLNEMAEMMIQNKSDEIKNENESFEEMQELFKEMFQNDIGAFGSCYSSDPSPCSSSSQASCSEMHGISNKRNSSELNSRNLMAEATKFEGFCIGVCFLSLFSIAHPPLICLLMYNPCLSLLFCLSFIIIIIFLWELTSVKRNEKSGKQRVGESSRRKNTRAGRR